MKYLSQSYVTFIVFGDGLLPSEFTNLVKLEPTDFGTKGEIIKFVAISKDTFWEYRLDDTNALEELRDSLDLIIDIFKSKREIINNYIQKNNLESSFRIVFKCRNKEDVGIMITPELIEYFHGMHSSFGIFFYPES
jgi:hypothetical protein